MILACVFIVLGFFFLVKGADVFVDSASGVATKLGVPTLVIGLTIVAFGTSMPELAVSVTAALEKANEIAVGNVVSSNIFNLLVVGGLSACIYPLIVNPAIMKRDWPLSTLAAGVLFLFLLPDLTISRIEAAILLVCFGFLLYVQIKHTKNETEEKKEEHRSMPKLLLLLVLGIAGIVIGGKLTVEGATSLARILGLSETLIGLTIVAIGTSLPELVTSVVAAKKGENEIAMGNIIGSNLFNILCILGISSILSPIHVEMTALMDVGILTLISLGFWFVCKKFSLDRRVGSIMVITYVIYMVYIILR